MNKTNLKVSLIYLEVNVAELSKKMTLVTIDNDDAYDQTRNEENNLLNIKVKLLREENFKINKTKEPEFFAEISDFFKDNKTLKYNDFLPFDASINDKSFKKEVMLKSKKYKPENEFEIFLQSHNILNAYYNKEITFIVKVDRFEYSSEFGEKYFSNEYKTNELNWESLNKEDEKIMEVYLSKTTSNLLSFSGINDDGEKIHFNFNSSKIKNNKL